LILAAALAMLWAGQAATTPTAPVAATPAAQSPATSAQGKTAPDNKPAKPDVDTGQPVKPEALHDRRKAAALYLKGVRLLEGQKPEQAWALLKQAASLEPFNSTYVRAAELSRQSAVTRLVEQASSDTEHGDKDTAQSELQRALMIDPQSQAAKQRLQQMAGAALLPQEAPRVAASAASSVGTTIADVVKQNGGRQESTVLGGPIVLEPTAGKHSFHLHSNAKQVIEEVFRAYGVEATVHESVKSAMVRMEMDDATFDEARRALGMETKTFAEPLDPHRVLVAADTRENRLQFQRLQMETVYLPGMTAAELTETTNLARNVFDAQQAVAEPGSGTLTLRAPGRSLAAFNRTMAQLANGRSQVDLDVKVIELSYTSARETGTKFFQQTGVYNVFSEINSVLSQNQSLVQQIISSGLVPNQSTLANQIEILAILVASGQLTGTPFNSGFLPFGGGLTQSILSPGPASLALSLNSSDTRELDDVHLRLQDDEAGTFKTGERYPIETSSYSSLALTAASAAGVTNETVPQIQYEDLGLTLKATPKVMRSGDVALTLDLKIEALGGTSLNGIPILDNRALTGVLTIKDGETAVLLSDINRQESRALSGLPGIGDIPGLQDISDIQKNLSVAKLLILVTPVVDRETVQAEHGPMMLLDKGTGTAH
jgi:general secretion pathway protein D